MQIPSGSYTQSPDTTFEKKSHSTKDSVISVEKRKQEIEELDDAIGKMSHTINAANYELMVLIREFDERAGWLKWSFKDGLNWLMWRCDLSTNAAREKLRMAHALKELPLISAAFSKGELSYTKVRALTRVATALNESELIEMAMRMSARHVEEHCKQRRNATRASTATALNAQQNRTFRVWHDQARGTVHFSVEMSVEEAELIEKAVEKAAVQLSADTGSSASMPEESVSWASQQSDALVFLCRSFLDGVAPTETPESFSDQFSGQFSSQYSDQTSSQSASPFSDKSDPPDTPNTPKTASSTADHYQVVIHVDEAALCGAEAGNSQYPIESVRRMCCDGSLIPLVENAKGEPLNVGRKVRTITTAIRRALWARDKGCGFPGCSHDRFVDAHHIQHWADGGETSVENLVLLCSTHHKLVHEGGYSIQRDQAGDLFFRRPDGKAVPYCGYNLDDQVESDVDVVADGSELDPAVTEYIKNSRSFLGARELSGDYCVAGVAAA